MDTLADAAMPPPLDLTARSFALLDQGERDRMQPLLRPLAWIDGLMTALVVAPSSAELSLSPVWLDYIWNEEKEAEILAMTPEQTSDFLGQATDHYCHVAACLLDAPEAYRPYLGGFTDQLEAAAQWAAGFCGGIGLRAEAWVPLFADEDALSLLVAIFCLVPDAELPGELKAESPFRDMPPDRRAHMRRSAVEMLPDIVRSLYDSTLDLEEAGASH
jgi:yecA family protein